MDDQLKIIINTGLNTKNTSQIEVDLKTIEKVLQDKQIKVNLGIDTNQIYKQTNTIAKQIKTGMSGALSLKNLELDKSKLSSNIQNYMNKNTKATKVFGDELVNIKSQIENADKPTLSNLNKQFQKVTASARELGLAGDTIGQAWKKNLASFTSFLSAGTLLMTAVNGIKNMYNSVVELDLGMVELRKVTDETEATYASFYTQANNMAKSLGISTSAVISATASWAQMGYSIQNASKLAEDSAIFSNISENMDIDTATATLISTVKAFGLNTNDVLDGVISKVNELGNQFAVTNTDVAVGLKESAAAMAVANNSLDQTTALITGITEVTQDASAAGKMYARVA